MYFAAKKNPNIESKTISNQYNNISRLFFCHLYCYKHICTFSIFTNMQLLHVMTCNLQNSLFLILQSIFHTLYKSLVKEKRHINVTTLDGRNVLVIIEISARIKIIT